MRSLSWGRIWAAVVCGAGVTGGREAAAQSYGGTAPAVAPSPAVQSMGAIPLFTPTVPNTTGDPSASLGQSPSSGNIFNSPLAAPLIYNSMLSASMPQGATSTSTSNSSASAMRGLGTTQLGMMLLLANQQNGGIGSGQMSGTRPQATGGASSSAGTKSRSTNRPGGLAARYFNRTASHPAYPRNYYNRRPSYFP